MKREDKTPVPPTTFERVMQWVVAGLVVLLTIYLLTFRGCVGRQGGPGEQPVAPIKQDGQGAPSKDASSGTGATPSPTAMLEATSKPSASDQPARPAREQLTQWLADVQQGKMSLSDFESQFKKRFSADSLKDAGQRSEFVSALVDAARQSQSSSFNKAPGELTAEDANLHRALLANGLAAIADDESSVTTVLKGLAPSADEITRWKEGSGNAEGWLHGLAVAQQSLAKSGAKGSLATALAPVLGHTMALEKAEVQTGLTNQLFEPWGESSLGLTGFQFDESSRKGLFDSHVETKSSGLASIWSKYGQPLAAVAPAAALGLAWKDSLKTGDWSAAGTWAKALVGSDGDKAKADERRTALMAEAGEAMAASLPKSDQVLDAGALKQFEEGSGLLEAALPGFKKGAAEPVGKWLKQSLADAATAGKTDALPGHLQLAQLLGVAPSVLNPALTELGDKAETAEARQKHWQLVSLLSSKVEKGEEVFAPAVDGSIRKAASAGDWGALNVIANGTNRAEQQKTLKTEVEKLADAQIADKGAEAKDALAFHEGFGRKLALAASVPAMGLLLDRATSAGKLEDASSIASRLAEADPNQKESVGKKLWNAVAGLLPKTSVSNDQAVQVQSNKAAELALQLAPSVKDDVNKVVAAQLQQAASGDKATFATAASFLMATPGVDKSAVASQLFPTFDPAKPQSAAALTSQTELARALSGHLPDADRTRVTTGLANGLLATGGLVALKSLAGDSKLGADATAAIQAHLKSAVADEKSLPQAFVAAQQLQQAGIKVDPPAISGEQLAKLVTEKGSSLSHAAFDAVSRAAVAANPALGESVKKQLIERLSAPGKQGVAEWQSLAKSLVNNPTVPAEEARKLLLPARDLAMPLDGVGLRERAARLQAAVSSGLFTPEEAKAELGQLVDQAKKQKDSAALASLLQVKPPVEGLEAFVRQEAEAGAADPARLPSVITLKKGLEAAGLPTESVKLPTAEQLGAQLKEQLKNPKLTSDEFANVAAELAKADPSAVAAIQQAASQRLASSGSGNVKDEISLAKTLGLNEGQVMAGLIPAVAANATPEQLKGHVDRLAQLRTAIDPAKLADASKAVAQAAIDKGDLGSLSSLLKQTPVAPGVQEAIQAAVKAGETDPAKLAKAGQLAELAKAASLNVAAPAPSREVLTEALKTGTTATPEAFAVLAKEAAKVPELKDALKQQADGRLANAAKSGASALQAELASLSKLGVATPQEALPALLQNPATMEAALTALNATPSPDGKTPVIAPDQLSSLVGKGIANVKEPAALQRLKDLSAKAGATAVTGQIASQLVAALPANDPKVPALIDEYVQSQPSSVPKEIASRVLAHLHQKGNWVEAAGFSISGRKSNLFGENDAAVLKDIDQFIKQRGQIEEWTKTPKPLNVFDNAGKKLVPSDTTMKITKVDGAKFEGELLVKGQPVGKVMGTVTPQGFELEGKGNEGQPAQYTFKAKVPSSIPEGLAAALKEAGVKETGDLGVLSSADGKTLLLNRGATTLVAQNTPPATTPSTTSNTPKPTTPSTPMPGQPTTPTTAATTPKPATGTPPAGTPGTTAQSGTTLAQNTGSKVPYAEPSQLPGSVGTSGQPVVSGTPIGTHGENQSGSGGGLVVGSQSFPGSHVTMAADGSVISGSCSCQSNYQPSCQPTCQPATTIVTETVLCQSYCYDRCGRCCVIHSYQTVQRTVPCQPASPCGCSSYSQPTHHCGTTCCGCSCCPQQPVRCGGRIFGGWRGRCCR